MSPSHPRRAPTHGEGSGGGSGNSTGSLSRLPGPQSARDTHVPQDGGRLSGAYRPFRDWVSHSVPRVRHVPVAWVFLLPTGPDRTNSVLVEWCMSWVGGTCVKFSGPGGGVFPSQEYTVYRPLVFV